MGYFNTDEIGSWNRCFNADRFHAQGHHQVWAQFFDLLCPDVPALRISSRPDSDPDGASSLVDILSEHLCLKTVLGEHPLDRFGELCFLPCGEGLGGRWLVEEPDVRK